VRETLLQLLRINVQRFRGGLEFKAHRLVYHQTLGGRVKRKKKTLLLAPLGDTAAVLRATAQKQQDHASGWG